MMRPASTFALLGALAAIGACSPEPDAAPAKTRTADTAATRAYRQANTGMHAGMAITYTGDPDTDFLQGMIPHHQGAIDMAKVELKHGRDPAVRAMAQQVIEAQEKEIAQMRGWLAQRGVAATLGTGEKAHH